MEQAPTSEYIALPGYRGHPGNFHMSCVALDAKWKFYRIFEVKGSGEPYTNSEFESYCAFLRQLIFLQIVGICRGLAYLHEQDPPVIHGDLRWV